MQRNEYVNFVLELLAPFGPVTARAMFGGYGLYKNGTIFALVADDVLYFKVAASNRPDYEAWASEPFTYEAGDGKRVAMSYWQVPLEVLEDSKMLTQWAEKAYQAALHGKSTRKKKAKAT